MRWNTSTGMMRMTAMLTHYPPPILTTVATQETTSCTFAITTNPLLQYTHALYEEIGLDMAVKYVKSNTTFCTSLMLATHVSQHIFAHALSFPDSLLIF